MKDWNAADGADQRVRSSAQVAHIIERNDAWWSAVRKTWMMKQM